MALPVTQEQAAILNNLKARGNPNVWSGTSTERKKKALSLYQKTGSKTHVCSELRMGRATLNNILKGAGLS